MQNLYEQQDPQGPYLGYGDDPFGPAPYLLGGGLYPPPQVSRPTEYAVLQSAAKDSSNNRIRYNPVYINQVAANIMNMNQEGRMMLGTGNKIVIYIEREPVIFAMPKRALLAISSVARKYFAAAPLSMSMLLEGGLISKEALRYICREWIFKIVESHTTFIMALATTFEANLDIYVSARHLGLQMPLGHIVTQLCNRIEDKGQQLIHYNELSRILQLHVNDPLYRCVIGTFGHWRYERKIPDPEYFEHWAQQYPDFVQAMDARDKKLNDKFNRDNQGVRQGRAEYRRVSYSPTDELFINGGPKNGGIIDVAYHIDAQQRRAPINHRDKRQPAKDTAKDDKRKAKGKIPSSSNISTGGVGTVSYEEGMRLKAQLRGR